MRVGNINKKSSIRRMLYVLAISSVSFSLLTACIWFSVFDQSSFKKRLLEKVTVISRITANNSQGALAFNDEETAKDLLKSLKYYKSIRYAAILDLDNKIFMDYKNRWDYILTPPLKKEGAEVNNEFIEVYIPIKWDGDSIGNLYVVSDLSELSERFYSAMFILLSCFFVSIILGVIFSSWFIKKITIEVNRIVRFFNDIAQKKGRYSVRANESSIYEIDLLVSGANFMLEEIQHYDNSRKKTEKELYETYVCIENKVSEYAQVIEKISSGDLRYHINAEDVGKGGDINYLAIYLNKMTQGLSAIVAQTRSASDELINHLIPVRHSVNEQTAGFAEQSVAIGNSVNKLSVIKKEANFNLEKIRRLTDVTDDLYSYSEKIVGALDNSGPQLYNTKSMINEISKNIINLKETSAGVQDIADSVSNLAEHLTILSLNASIECSKAGLPGKGFAVVAGEVKLLAQQSQEMITGIKGIFDTITKSVDKTIELADKGGRSIDNSLNLQDNIREMIADLNVFIDSSKQHNLSIIKSVQDEVSDINFVNGAMVEINEIISYYVKSLDSTKNAVEALVNMSNTMTDSVNVYRINDL